MSSGTLAQQVAKQIEWFLAEAPRAVAIEDGAVMFDFTDRALLGFAGAR
jgi:hypothetical protein